jgi:DNA-binding XRE family transcriptional regulator
MKNVLLVRLKEQRNSRDWTQDMLANFSGLSVRTIQRIESGERVNIETAKSLAATFGMESYADLTATHAGEGDNEAKSADGSHQECAAHRSITKEQAEMLHYIRWMGYILTPLFIGSMLIKVLSSPTGSVILMDALLGMVKATGVLALIATSCYFLIRKKAGPKNGRSLSFSLFGVGASLIIVIYSGIGFHKGFDFVRLKVDHIQFIESASDVGNLLSLNSLNGDTTTMSALKTLDEDSAMVDRFIFTINAVDTWDFLSPCIPKEGVDQDMSVALYLDLIYRYNRECAPA